jgi:hypothetical protein
VDIEIESSDDDIGVELGDLVNDNGFTTTSISSPTFIDFDEFMRNYWPRFSQREKKNLGVYLVLDLLQFLSKVWRQ